MSGNTSTGNVYGTLVNSSYSNVLKENTLQGNTHGVRLTFSGSNSAYNNNFLGNTTQASDVLGAGNAFYQPAPAGGNYWIELSGCADTDHNGFCDAPYSAGAVFDAFPLAQKFLPDHTAPVLHLPGEVILGVSTPSGTVYNYIVDATDDFDPSPSVSCAPGPGTLFPLGPTQIDCTATDAAGNSRTGSFNVIVHYVGLDYAILAAGPKGADIGVGAVVEGDWSGGTVRST
ncbi:MAG: HYR domain-containing protein [SAR202 cluster bacterium]|nr:HYR domain-containing protein [SAR202 cluster bacterium]